MRKRPNRPVSAVRRRWQERRALDPIVSLKVNEREMAGAGDRNKADNQLRILAITTDHLKRELDTLRQLREAVVVAERAYVGRAPH